MFGHAQICVVIFKRILYLIYNWCNKQKKLSYTFPGYLLFSNMFKNTIIKRKCKCFLTYNYIQLKENKNMKKKPPNEKTKQNKTKSKHFFDFRYMYNITLSFIIIIFGFFLNASICFPRFRNKLSSRISRS